jgi:hypothetical protein
VKPLEVLLMKYVLTFKALVARFLLEFFDRSLNQDMSAVQLFSITCTVLENLEIHLNRK